MTKSNGPTSAATRTVYKTMTTSAPQGSIRYAISHMYYMFEINFGSYFLSGTEKHIYNAVVLFALVVIIRYIFTFGMQLFKFLTA